MANFASFFVTEEATLPAKVLYYTENPILRLRHVESLRVASPVVEREFPRVPQFLRPVCGVVFRVEFLHTLRAIEIKDLAEEAAVLEGWFTRSNSRHDDKFCD